MKHFLDKVVVITGGAAGIGAVTVRKFAEEGANVLIWDVSEELGEALASEIQQAEFQKVNVADRANVQSAVNKVIEKYGKIDVLINNAGITQDVTLLKMEEAQWDAVIDINLKGVFNCSQATAKVMAEKRSGVIINTSSIVALYGNFGQTNYVASKSGIIGMTKVWAKELGRKGIRVNAVAPGFIATDMVKTVPEKVINMLKEKTPLGRLGDPNDIANTYLFLASDEASFITGTVISVDGGLVI
ncbi:3-oxoacyl-ACP reductase [candidate division KSB1 bacterium 4572_119]|nr:MAG: 3-oxoacyl-ACP reductase [candidate division KSB1 bacterium 4572_119]